jgi:hypothetical protein
MAWTKMTKQTTKHTHPVVFGRREAGCPRCAELDAGAAPVKGWGTAKREREVMFSRALDDHFAPGGPHARGECGPVCTFGDP